MSQNEEDLYRGEGQVLHSWKSIAKFLSRSVRTARRWEENENLPVRRHKHLKNNSVFAYTHELEQWLHGRELPNPSLEPVSPYKIVDKLSASNNNSSVGLWKGFSKWFQQARN